MKEHPWKSLSKRDVLYFFSYFSDQKRIYSLQRDKLIAPLWDFDSTAGGVRKDSPINWIEISKERIRRGEDVQEP